MRVDELCGAAMACRRTTAKKTCEQKTCRNPAFRKLKSLSNLPSWINKPSVQTRKVDSAICVAMPQQPLVLSTTRLSVPSQHLKCNLCAWTTLKLQVQYAQEPAIPCKPAMLVQPMLNMAVGLLQMHCTLMLSESRRFVHY